MCREWPILRWGNSMKFICAAPPTQTLEISGAQPIRLPALLVISFAGVLVGGVLLAAAAALLQLTGQLPDLMKQFKLALDTQPPLIFLGSLALVLMVHEAVHLLFYPGSVASDRKILGILPKTGLAYAWCGLPMRRNRYLLVGIAPFLFLSVIPLVLFSSYPSQVGPLLPMVLFNMLGAGGDAMVLYYVLRQIPSQAWLQLSGGTTYWGTYASESSSPPAVHRLPE